MPYVSYAAHIQLHYRKQAAIAAAVRRLVEGPGLPSGRPRLLIVCAGNGADRTNFRGRPPSSHLAVERALHEVANVFILRIHEAGTTKVCAHASALLGSRRSASCMADAVWPCAGCGRPGHTGVLSQYLPDERFCEERLVLARPCPLPKSDQRGLRIAASTGIVYDRDYMSGASIPCA